MKKTILTVLCVVIVMTLLAACGRGNVGDHTTSHTTTTTTTTTKRTTTENKTDSTTGILASTTDMSMGTTTRATNG